MTRKPFKRFLVSVGAISAGLKPGENESRQGLLSSASAVFIRIRAPDLDLVFVSVI